MVHAESPAGAGSFGYRYLGLLVQNSEFRGPDPSTRLGMNMQACCALRQGRNANLRLIVPQKVILQCLNMSCLSHCRV